MSKTKNADGAIERQSATPAPKKRPQTKSEGGQATTIKGVATNSGPQKAIHACVKEGPGTGSKTEKKSLGEHHKLAETGSSITHPGEESSATVETTDASDADKKESYRAYGESPKSTHAHAANDRAFEAENLHYQAGRADVIPRWFPPGMAFGRMLYSMEPNLSICGKRVFAVPLSALELGEGECITSKQLPDFIRDNIIAHFKEDCLLVHVPHRNAGGASPAKTTRPDDAI
jgi:hypothetical protein